MKASTSDASKSSVYASVDAGNPNRVVVVASNKTHGALKATISVTHTVQFTKADAWQLTGASLTIAAGRAGLPVDPSETPRLADLAPDWLAMPTRGGTRERKPTFVRPHTLNHHLRRALATCDLQRLTWYRATRHTFASQRVLSGGSIEKLATVMGHSSTAITERYAHMRPDLFRDGDYEVISVKLGRAPTPVAAIVDPSESGAGCYVIVTQADPGSASGSVSG